MSEYKKRPADDKSLIELRPFAAHEETSDVKIGSPDKDKENPSITQNSNELSYQSIP